MKLRVVLGAAVVAAGAAFVYTRREQIQTWIQEKIEEDLHRARIAAREAGERQHLGDELADQLMPGIGRS